MAAASAAASGALLGITRISSVDLFLFGSAARLSGWKLSASQPARPDPCAATRRLQAPRSSFSTPPARQMFIQYDLTLMSSDCESRGSKVSIEQSSG